MPQKEIIFPSKKCSEMKKVLSSTKRSEGKWFLFDITFLHEIKLSKTFTTQPVNLSTCYSVTCYSICRSNKKISVIPSIEHLQDSWYFVFIFEMIVFSVFRFLFSELSITNSNLLLGSCGKYQFPMKDTIESRQFIKIVYI